MRKFPVRVVREFDEETGVWVFRPQVKDNCIGAYMGEYDYGWRNFRYWSKDLQGAVEYLNTYNEHFENEVVYNKEK